MSIYLCIYVEYGLKFFDDGQHTQKTAAHISLNTKANRYLALLTKSICIFLKNAQRMKLNPFLKFISKAFCELDHNEHGTYIRR